MISGKATALQEQKIVQSGMVFGLRHKSRLTYTRFTAQQRNLSSSTLCLLNQRIEDIKLIITINQYRTYDRLMKQCRHDAHCPLAEGCSQQIDTESDDSRTLPFECSIAF